MTTRAGTRRLILGAVLAVATTASVGDDVVGAPDVHRGSRTVTTDLPAPLGPTTLHVPRTPASGVALLLHDADPGSLTAIMEATAATTLLVPVDVRRFTQGTPPPCEALVDVLAAAARRAQRDAGLTTYRPPVLVGTAAGAGLARTLLATSDPGLFPRGVGTPPSPSDPHTPWCVGPALERTAPPRWRAVAPASLAAATREALAVVTPPPTTGHVPLDRWLTHFRLPLSAAWAAQPRAVYVHMSDARGLRLADTRLARDLAARGVSVIAVDALRYFWQRRSPRDVAFELRRLMGALESLDVPILAGGSGFGAETMAVAMRFVDDAPLAGLVLVNPGPAAFFEIEPPLPALVPLLRHDWSMEDAVSTLAVPTLCVTTGEERARVLCESLRRADAPSDRAVHHVPLDEDALAGAIATFAGDVRAAQRGDDAGGAATRQPRKPST